MDDVEQLKLMLKKYLEVKTTSTGGYSRIIPARVEVVILFDGEEICKDSVSIK